MFNIGDKVICVYVGTLLNPLVEGNEYTISHVDHLGFVELENVNYICGRFHPDRFVPNVDLSFLTELNIALS